MCGIVGILGKLPSRQAVIKARDAMWHRGPDDGGLYYSQKENIALGHRRLAIIDLSAAGHQPLFSNDQRYVIVFNGEIYNYLELKEKLKNFYDFKTKTDTEVLLAAYIKWGTECFKHIQGMFAFAVWDKAKRELVVARDRLGIKPLYYHSAGKNFMFGSEIKAILPFLKNTRKLNHQGFLDYLSYRDAIGPNTLYQDVFSLLPGHYLVLKRGGRPKLVKYWDLPIVKNKKDPDLRTVLREAEQIIKDTVRAHMMSDVPVGAYLSGGLDSSLLVALMSNISRQRINTFSIGFPEEGYNEFKYARVVSRLYNTNHQEITLNGKQYLDLIPEVIKYKDAPLSIPNEIAVHVLSKKLKESITVVLSGEGADELFGGYGRIFRSGYDFERMLLLRDQDYLSSRSRNILINNLNKKYGDFTNLTDLDHFLCQYDYFGSDNKKAILNPDLFADGDDRIFNKSYFKALFKKLSPLSTSEKYIYIFQKFHLLAPLRRLDANTMSKSVEARVPFVDHKLVEYVSALSLKYKLAWLSSKDKKAGSLLNSDQISDKHDLTKFLFRAIAKKYFPKEIVNRKKVGFPVPLDTWFSGKFNDYARDILLSPKAKSSPLYRKQVLRQWLEKDFKKDKHYGYNIWMMVNAEIWMQEYNVSI